MIVTFLVSRRNPQARWKIVPGMGRPGQPGNGQGRDLTP